MTVAVEQHVCRSSAQTQGCGVSRRGVLEEFLEEHARIADLAGLALLFATKQTGAVVT